MPIPQKRGIKGDDRVAGENAGYMELEGAKKDGDCHLVRVHNGISKELGCCSIYEPRKGADEFNCGHCIHER